MSIRFKTSSPLFSSTCLLVSVMPQPLSKVLPKCSYRIGNIGDRALSERPKLAVLAMEAIASWANVEAYLLATFIQLMGGKDNRAASVYLSLNSQAPKTQAIQAVARGVLTKEQKAVLDAILSIAKTNQPHRDRIAHGVWGVSDDLPDALLLTTNTAMHSSYVSKEDILVYREIDFKQIIEANDRLCGYAGTFWHVARGRRGKEPKPKASDVVSLLSLVPEIQERLNRRA